MRSRVACLFAALLAASPVAAQTCAIASTPMLQQTYCHWAGTTQGFQAVVQIRFTLKKNTSVQWRTDWGGGWKPRLGSRTAGNQNEVVVLGDYLAISKPTTYRFQLMVGSSQGPVPCGPIGTLRVSPCRLWPGGKSALDYGPARDFLASTPVVNNDSSACGNGGCAFHIDPLVLDNPATASFYGKVGASGVLAIGSRNTGKPAPIFGEFLFQLDVSSIVATLPLTMTQIVGAPKGEGGAQLKFKVPKDASLIGTKLAGQAAITHKDGKGAVVVTNAVFASIGK